MTGHLIELARLAAIAQMIQYSKVSERRVLQRERALGNLFREACDAAGIRRKSAMACARPAPASPGGITSPASRPAQSRDSLTLAFDLDVIRDLLATEYV